MTPEKLALLVRSARRVRSEQPAQPVPRATRARPVPRARRVTPGRTPRSPVRLERLVQLGLLVLMGPQVQRATPVRPVLLVQLEPSLVRRW